MRKVSTNDDCFVCGKDNRDGLQLPFELVDGKARGRYLVEEKYQGYTRILHGGMTGMLLDEIMAKPLNLQGITSVTAQMTVDYLLPVETGQTVELEGEIVRQEGRKVYTEGRLILADGRTAARGTGLMILVKDQEGNN